MYGVHSRINRFFYRIITDPSFSSSLGGLVVRRHISWDKSSCMLIRFDGTAHLIKKGDTFIFNFYFCIIFSSQTLSLLQIRLEIITFKKLTLSCFLNSCCLMFCFGCLIDLLTLAKDTTNAWPYFVWSRAWSVKSLHFAHPTLKKKSYEGHSSPWNLSQTVEIRFFRKFQGTKILDRTIFPQGCCKY